MRFLCPFILLLALASQAAELQGRVVGITDGDTLTLLDANNVQHKIRLAGIDAPEKHQDFGSKATQSLGELVFAKTVTVQTSKTDRYGRAIGKVLIREQDASLLQVQRGLAWHYKAYEKEQSPTDRLLFDMAEREAQVNRRGLWQDPNPTPPWDFRRISRGR